MGSAPSACFFSGFGSAHPPKNRIDTQVPAVIAGSLALAPILFFPNGCGPRGTLALRERSSRAVSRVYFVVAVVVEGLGVAVAGECGVESSGGTESAFHRNVDDAVIGGSEKPLGGGGSRVDSTVS